MVIPFIITPESRPNSFAALKASKEEYSGPTRCEFVKMRQKLLASRFRDKMTEGSSFEEANEYRQTFFEDVIIKADQVGFRGWFLRFEDDHPSSSPPKSLQGPLGVLIPFLMASYSS
jgi:hypothetical protein